MSAQVPGIKSDTLDFVCAGETLSCKKVEEFQEGDFTLADHCEVKRRITNIFRYK
jgi:hypothetical protein